MNLGRVVETQWRAVVVVIILLSIGGLVAMTRIPLSLFPQTDFPRIIIVVDNGVAPAQQTLVSVTRPIEEAMSGIPGIARIKSTTARGATEIDLFFDWKTEHRADAADRAGQDVAARERRCRRAHRFDTRRTGSRSPCFPIIGYSITSPKRDPGTLRTWPRSRSGRRWRAFRGVASVAVRGGQMREYHVLDRSAHGWKRAASRSQQVVDAVKNANVIDSPGLINENHQLELALVSGQATTLDELGRIVVATVNNVPVRVGDVATVRPRPRAALHNRHRRRPPGGAAQRSAPADREHRRRSPMR